MNELHGARIHITGIVQGVGFRPFVYNLALELGLTGWVRNTSAGVDIQVDGTLTAIERFVKSLKEQAPPLAHIDNLEIMECPPNGYAKFEILHSTSLPEAFQPISPDVGICPDCLKEVFDPNDRRYRYPFTNCTNCGPRFTIIRDIPYDRPNTTMAGFPMCPECAAEYSDPQNRRFHAQPIACPSCGPSVWLEYPTLDPQPSQPLDQALAGNDAILECQRMLAQGKIIAIKGLGGFHLACDATNQAAVQQLRQRKLRVDKPFALMLADMETVVEHCFVSQAERQLLESHQRPIVLLNRRPDSNIAYEVAPGQNTLGIMLPYTPLHYLIFSQPDSSDQLNSQEEWKVPKVLVMTSGNLSEEPIAYRNEEAQRRLANLADAFLMNDRPIHVRCDDSVVRVFSNSIYPIRRSRGYAPAPVTLPWDTPPLLATGAELKNTFCLARNRQGFISHHIGDLENFETLQSFEEGIAHYERLFRIQPEVLAYDLHPNYLATRYALTRASEENLPSIGVQHHHAHIAACLTDNGLPMDETVLGVAFDGTGYGDDGTIWGGEFLLANCHNYQRVAHLAYVPLPGGDAAIKKPARTALAYLATFGLDWSAQLPPVNALTSKELIALRSQLSHGINTPMTSSVGRLFDAVASLLGVRHQINYEAQAAIELEALVDPGETKAYSFEYAPLQENTPMIINPAPLLKAIIDDLSAGLTPSVIAARFHNGLSEMIVSVLMAMRNAFGVSLVALSGGVWQNMTLLNLTTKRLTQMGFKILWHQKVPGNDGGISLGQAAVAAAKILSGN